VIGSAIPSLMHLPIRVASGTCSASQLRIMVHVSVMLIQRTSWDRHPLNSSASCAWLSARKWLLAIGSSVGHRPLPAMRQTRRPHAEELAVTADSAVIFGSAPAGFFDRFLSDRGVSFYQSSQRILTGCR
jgi:hypothetical protein